MTNAMHEFNVDGVNRREFLRIGALGSALLAPGLPSLAAGSIVPGLRTAPCLFLFLEGGMSHVDLWDPKPAAPRDERSEFAPIATAVPGLRVSSLLPRIAAVADRIAIVRSMTHGTPEHGPASALMTASGHIGYLAGDHRWTECPFHFASELVQSDDVRAALSREPDSVREDYGLTDLGQSCLWASRRIESGERFVGIRCGHWDTHRRNAWCLNELLAPALDRALAALVGDLGRRGLLSTMRLVVATEFGRSPRLNREAGRDHWPSAFSIVLAGAGIPGGRTIGATDDRGAFVTECPVTPDELAATIA